MLSVHVDDQLIACNNRSALDDFKRQLNAQFECSDSGPAGYFLGFNIYRDRATWKLYISQECRKYRRQACSQLLPLLSLPVAVF
jgi:hypothetical protein